MLSVMAEKLTFDNYKISCSYWTGISLIDQICIWILENVSLFGENNGTRNYDIYFCSRAHDLFHVQFPVHGGFKH